MLTAVLVLPLWFLFQSSDLASERTASLSQQQKQKEIPQRAASARCFVGIEIGPEILSALLEWKSLNNWSQPEIDAYYEVLDFARKTPFAQQKAKAKKNLFADLKHFRERIRESSLQHRKQLNEREAKNPDEAARYRRLRAHEERRLKQLLKQVRTYENKPNSYPLFTQLLVSLLNENKPRRVRAAVIAVAGAQASGFWSLKPPRFQGKLVTLKGQVRKLVSYCAHKNKFGITTLYEAWLFTDDSGALAAKQVGKKRVGNHGQWLRETLGKIPVVVIFTQKPAGMPEGDQILEAATVTGYVFRMYQYEDKRNTEFLAIAPLLLAQRIEWHPRKSAKPTPVWVSVAIVTSLVAVFLMIVWAGVRDAKRRRKQRTTMTESETLHLPASEQ